MKYSPTTIGFLQAAGLFIYISLFANLAMFFGNHFPAPHDPVLQITVFLLAFVISALICGSLVLGYPIVVFFHGEKKEAPKTVAMSIVWLVALLTVFLTILGTA